MGNTEHAVQVESDYAGNTEWLDVAILRDPKNVPGWVETYEKAGHTVRVVERACIDTVVFDQTHSQVVSFHTAREPAEMNARLLNHAAGESARFVALASE